MNKPSNFFWCGHRGTAPSWRVEDLVKQMDGSYVEIDGFDEMMQELLWVFDETKPIKEELDAITKSRIEAMDMQLNEMNIASGKAGAQKTAQELSAFEYSKMADNEPDYEKRKAIYLQALKHFPNTAWLWNEFTFFLHFVKKEYSNLEEYYLNALSVDPEDANNNGNYAVFLKDIKKDYANAEKYYLKALSIDPENANKNGNYAVFLKSIKRDYANAEKYYLKALSLAPENANKNGNYAVFLKDAKQDYASAERYYNKALSIDPENANKNGNYAGFLLVTNRIDEATKYLALGFQLNNNERKDLLVELWFYKYAHYFESIIESENIIEKLLKEGYRSIGWNLDLNVETAIKNGHQILKN